MTDYIKREDEEELRAFVEKILLRKREEMTSMINKRKDDYIKRKATIKAFSSKYDECADIAEIIETLDNQPSADVVSREAYEQIKWERDTAIAQLEELGYGLGDEIRNDRDPDEVTELPSADVRENVKGEWQPIEVQPYFKKHFDTSVACSVCHRKGNKRWNYCPNCGADMRGGDA